LNFTCISEVESQTKRVSIKQKRELQILILQLWVYPGMQKDHFIAEASIVLENRVYTSLSPRLTDRAVSISFSHSHYGLYIQGKILTAVLDMPHS